MEHRRLLLDFGRNLREINREIINPVVDALNLEDLDPLMRMVAHARADYLKALFALAAQTGGNAAPEDVAELAQAKAVFEELIAAVSALESMIKRGYIDVGDATPAMDRSSAVV